MKKVLIISHKAGAGHVKAAAALAAEAATNKNLQVRHIDILDYTNPLIRLMYGEAYLDVVKLLPKIYAQGYKNYRLVKWFTAPRLLLDKFNFNHLFKLLKTWKPDTIITTHFIPSGVLANFKHKKNAPFKLITVLTDYEYHPLWFHPYVDHFCVATESMKKAFPNNFSREKISITGIPTHPKFAKTKKRRNATPILFLSAGSFGVTSLTEIIDELEIFPPKFEIQVVCGKNGKLKKQLEKRQKTNPHLKKIYGFVDFMDKLMAESDIFITKPGGLSVTEAIVSGLPMILIDPIPGQEEANAKYLTQNGAAIEAHSTAEIINHLEKLLENPSQLASMRKNAQKIAKPNAANDILNLIP